MQKKKKRSFWYHDSNSIFFQKWKNTIECLIWVSIFKKMCVYALSTSYESHSFQSNYAKLLLKN